MLALGAGRPILVVALLLCLLKGIVAAWATPAFQTPDEYGHYDYVLYLSRIDLNEFLRGRVAKPTAYNDVTTDELWAVTRATGTESHLRGPGLNRPLPDLQAQLAAGRSYLPSDSHASLRDKTVVPAQFNYPILYYGSLALLVKGVRLITSNPVIAYYVARTMSLVLLLATVWFTWRTARVIFDEPGSGTAVALATLFVALHPQLTMLGTSVQSDMLTVVLMTMTGFYGARLANEPSSRDVVILAVVTAALMLTKLHAAVVAIVAVSILIAWMHYTAHRLRDGTRALLLFWVLVVVLGAWWYARSYYLYGSPTGMVVGEFRTQLFGTPRQNIKAWLSMARLTHDSFWGMWGWLEVPLPEWAYRVLAFTAVCSGAYAVRSMVVIAARQRLTARGTLFWLAWGGGYAIIMVAVAAVIGPVHNNQGRHWLPVVLLPALALGWCGVLTNTSLERRIGAAVAWLWGVLLLGANVLLVMRTVTFYRG